MRNALGDAGLLVLRLGLGFGIACHGHGKIFDRGMSVFVQIVATMGFPCPEFFAWAAALTEFLGGACIALGLAARPMAGLLFVSMSAAVFVHHAGVPLSARELPLAYWTAALALACTGPGRFSLDHILGRGAARRFLLAGAVLSVLPAGAAKAPLGEVRGRLFLRSSDVRRTGGPARPREVSGVVVHLVPLGHDLKADPPAAHPVLSQRYARFNPPLLVVIKGQSVDMPNDDDIVHNVFSFSAARSFDLGVYPKGQMKTVVFDREGPVLIFCSIHEQMNGVIYVVPNALYAVTDSQGRFSITGVPAGKYQARTWHAALPAAVKHVDVRNIDVLAGQAAIVDINLADLISPGGK